MLFSLGIASLVKNEPRLN